MEGKVNYLSQEWRDEIQIRLKKEISPERRRECSLLFSPKK